MSFSSEASFDDDASATQRQNYLNQQSYIYDVVDPMQAGSYRSGLPVDFFSKLPSTLSGQFKTSTDANGKSTTSYTAAAPYGSTAASNPQSKVAYYDQSGNAYNGPLYARIGAGDGAQTLQVNPGYIGALASTPDYQSGQLIYSYDPSKYNSAALAFLANAGVNGGHGFDTSSIANAVNNLHLDPQKIIDSARSGGLNFDWSNPANILQAATYGGYSGAGASQLKDLVNSQDFNTKLQQLSDIQNYQWQASHPRQSLTGSDYFNDIILPALSIALPAFGGVAGFGDVASGIGGAAADLADETAAALGNVEGFGAAADAASEASAALNNLPADFSGDIFSKLQNTGTSLGKKALLQAITHKGKVKLDPLSAFQTFGGAPSTFSSGGIVGDFDGLDDFGNATSFDFGSVPADFFGPSDSADFYSLPELSQYLSSGASAVDPLAASMGFGEHFGTPDETDSNSAESSTPDAASPNSAKSSGLTDQVLKKLGYVDDKGGVNWGNVLKSGATMASLVASYLNNKKLATQGTQLAAAQLQPAKIFTIPGTALSGAPNFAIGNPQNSNSHVKLYAHGGMAHAPMLGGLSALALRVHSGPGGVHGPGGGQDDLVDARLSPGEYVFDADTVAALGDGSSEEGARRLDAWREHLRKHKRSAPSDEIPPKSRPAPHYLTRS